MSEKKQCIACGKEVNKDMHFCPYCGKSGFRPIGLAANNDYYGNIQNVNNMQNINNNMPNMNVYDEIQNSNPYLEPKKKTKNFSWKKGLGIVAVVALVIALGVYSGVIKFNNFSVEVNKSDGSNTTLVKYDSEETKNVDGSSESSVAYSKGELTTTEYSNEWLGIRMNIPAGYTNASQEKYNTYNSNTVDCLAYLDSDEGTIAILSEDLQGYDLSSEQYLENVVTGLKSTNPDLTNVGSNELNIQGLPFKSTYYSMDVQGYKVLESIYVTRKDDKCVSVIITTLNGTISNSDAILNSIAKY